MGTLKESRFHNKPASNDGKKEPASAVTKPSQFNAARVNDDNFVDITDLETIPLIWG